MQLSKFQINIIIAITGAVFFIPFLGHVHLFDWDEINFAESAREMIVTGDYLNVRINFVPFWEKPPLFIWLQVCSMKLFGINEFAARFPNAIAGIITLLVLYNIGSNFNQKLGIVWAGIYMASLLPFLYFKSGIIDPWFNLFIFLGIYYAFRYFQLRTAKNKHAILSALFIGLSVLTKGPVGMLISGLSILIFLIVNKFNVKTSIKHILWFTLVLLFVGGFWFILQIASGNFNVIRDFIVYQIGLFQTKGAGHGGFLFYHFVVLFFGVFPASALAINNLFSSGINKTNNLPVFNQWMQILFWTVLILFTIVKTKIVHYSSMCYFPLTFLAASSLVKLSDNNMAVNKFSRVTFIIVGSAISMALMLFSFINYNRNWIISQGLISDPFAVEQFMANSQWKGFEWMVGALFMLLVVYCYMQLKKPIRLVNLSPLLGFSILYFFTITLFAPRAEEYSQKVFIDFMKSKQNEACYIQMVGMKSYAQYFYAQVKPSENNHREFDWYINGNIDKPVYFVMRNKRKQKFMEQHKNVELIDNKNGYVFFKRYADKNIMMK